MTQKVQRTDLGWRGNKAFFKVVFDGSNGTAADALISITDSKTFTWNSAAATDSGKDISRFFRDFVIQRTAGTNNLPDVTIQINAGGGWITCPNGLITAQSNANAVLRDGQTDLAYVKLPPGCGLRLSLTSVPTDATGEIFVQMSNSSEKADIARS